MNLFHALMARRMQQNAYGGRTAASTGCGCLGSIVSLVILGASLWGGLRVWDAATQAVDESMAETNDMVEDMVEESRSGDVSGIGYEGTYTCDVEGDTPTATLELTNTDPEPHTFDLTWSLYSVPTADVDFDDFSIDTGLGDGDVLESVTDNFAVAAGETVTRTYEMVDLGDENVGCTAPFLMTDLPGGLPAEIPEGGGL